ncbi:precorrin-3B synthase [Angustibacter sp. McL0619]|uniref:precorrin-3B synthase n=1 Tax=Angustibacter sp. McL0619 TaxID=3415676 RepID=UPI003CFB4B33
MSRVGSRRDAVDACPGALRPHVAADGGLIRLRLPGGVISATALTGLAGLAERFGDGALHLTSRGNLQLRGLRLVDGWVDPVLVQQVQRLGLLPAPAHELVRNVLASPSLPGSRIDLRPLVRALDTAICTDPALARLPGRFLFALDDGRADVVGAGSDVGWWADSQATGTLVLAGLDTGLRINAGHSAWALTVAAQAFLRLRDELGSTSWRLAELDGAADRARDAVRASLPHRQVPVRRVPPAADRLERLGLLEGPGGRHSVAALVPLGRLSASAARTIATSCSGEVLVTPWREVVLVDLSPAQARAALGTLAALPSSALELSERSGWHGVSACAGRPGCARALADVRAMAAAAAGARRPDDERVHFSGCERRCGRPAGSHREIVMTMQGLFDGPASTQQNGSE